MKIVSIKVKNYKAFRDLEISGLPGLAIFVGANGVGKTTLFDIFGFIKDALNHNVQQALLKRGGFKEVRSRGQQGNIEIELQFRIMIANKERLVTYRLVVGESDCVPVVAREVLRYKRGSYGSPYHFLDFRKGSGYAITNEEDFDKKDEELDREKQQLGSPDILAIKGLGQFERFKAASAFRNFIEGWHVSDFHISDARPSREAGYAEHLSPTGDNLPLVAQFMNEHHPGLFKQVLDKMAKRVPGIDEVRSESTIDGRIVLQFKDGSFKDPFIAKHASDGTIKMFAYLILLNDPNPHPMLCIEEPENQLYPHLLDNLLSEFRQYTQKGSQLFLSSHSPDLVNGAEPEEVYWLTKEQGYTTVKRASDDEKITALYKQGEKLGYLWKQKYFTGADPAD